MDCTKKVDFYPWIEDAIEKMVDKGMFYYSEKNISTYDNILDKELQCFFNIIQILRLLMKTGKKEYILEHANRKKLEKYIKFGLMAYTIEKKYETEILDLSKISLEHINFSKTNLTRTNMQMVNLSHANLYNANLSGINLQKANLKNSHLEKTNLKDTNLEDAHLEGAHLEQTNFVGAILQETNFDETDLNGAIFDVNQIKKLKKKYKDDYLKGVWVYINDTNQTMSYEEYNKSNEK